MFTQNSPAASPPLSSNWRADHNEYSAPTSLDDADNSLFDIPIPSHPDDEYPFMPNGSIGFEFGLEAWPCSEPIIKDETLFPFDNVLESEIAANPRLSCLLNTAYLPWEDSHISYITVLKTEQDRSQDCTLLSEAARSSARSVSSTESVQSHFNPCGRKPSLEADLCPSDKSVSLHSKRTKRKRKGPSKAAAHNLIEKKYRSNLNEKMIALRDSVPSLRTASDSAADSACGKESTRKLNKVGIYYIAPLFCSWKTNKQFYRHIFSLKREIIFDI